MRFLYTLFIIIICSMATQAQLVYEIDQSIPVTLEGKVLRFPWAGGLNAAQYSTMDLNGDGVEDLVVFDRTASKVYPFLVHDRAYIYVPEYAFHFPKELRNWMLFRDFNCDGKKDIFTSHSFGIRVYINETTTGGFPVWREYVTGQDNNGEDQYFLKTQGFTSEINLQMNAADLPAIVDIDGDSDLDILIFKPSGASTIELHRNLSMETYGTCDSLKYERVTQNWGGLKECDCGVFAFNDNECFGAGGREEHQGGKAILLMDRDNDGDMDLLISEEECPNLFYLENEGTTENPVFNAATSDFPNASNPVFMPYFPTPFWEDVDFDGEKDLIVSPGVSSNASNAINFQASSWFYKNTLTTENPDFSFIQRDFLQNEMLDLGENAAPAFADYDNDGDMDMFVGSYINNQASQLGATLHLYKNIGSASAPSFKLLDDNHLGLSVINLFNIKPKFKDVNGDNRLDLVFSATERFTFMTKIFYMLNQGDGTFSFKLPLKVLVENIGLSENFELSDINGDGLLDLLLGKGNGRLEYHKNVGDKNNPQFQLEDETFYGFDFSTSRFNMSIAIADLNGDGKPDMVIGDQRGSLTIYEDFLNDLENPRVGMTDFVNTPFEGSEPTSFNFGGKLYPVVANLFNEDKPAIIIGTGQGGMHVLKNTETQQGRDNKVTIDIYPNPIIKGGSKMLTISSKISGNVTIVSILGQQMMEGFLLQSNRPYEFSVDNFRTGLYLVLLSMGDGVISQKFIVID